jgi:hypothetical protein
MYIAACGRRTELTFGASVSAIARSASLQVYAPGGWVSSPSRGGPRRGCGNIYLVFAVVLHNEQHHGGGAVRISRACARGRWHGRRFADSQRNLRAGKIGMSDAKRMRLRKLARAGVIVGCALAGLVASSSFLTPLHAAAGPGVIETRSVCVTLLSTAAAAPGLRGDVHRSIARTENSFERLLLSFASAVVVWSWILVHGIVFLFVAAIASALDLRLLALSRESGHSVGAYLGAGVRTFFALLVDRSTPHRARLVVVVALLYALFPGDLIPDASWLTGYIDDLVVLVVGARLFIRLCPDTLVERHAAVVESHLRA